MSFNRASALFLLGIASTYGQPLAEDQPALQAPPGLPIPSVADRLAAGAPDVISVTGTEATLYKWSDPLNIPDQFGIGSQIFLTPNPSDDTKIDCATTFDQWFVPNIP
jgi:hypothetical protein